jgi:hypothetical protein
VHSKGSFRQFLNVFFVGFVKFETLVNQVSSLILLSNLIEFGLYGQSCGFIG